MRVRTHRQISELIKELKVNDGKKAFEYEEQPREPRKSMHALVRVGRPAVESLLELLKDRSKYSCLYAIEVLGEIGDPRAVQPIIDALSSEAYGEAFELAREYDQAILAMQKIGLPALEHALNYLDEAKEKDDEIDLINALEIIAGINDEKSFMTLGDMLSHSNGEIQVVAARLLGEYGDKRAVIHLKKLLKDELLQDVHVRNAATDALRKLVPTREYRDIIAPYALERVKLYCSEIENNLRSLEFAHEYPRHFEGDDAKELNAIALECKVGKSVKAFLRDAIELAVYEAVIPDDISKNLFDMLLNLPINEVFDERQEEIEIIEGDIPGYYFMKEEKRSYKGLAPESSWVEHPKLDMLRAKILKWLKKQEFRVLMEGNSFFARKGVKETRKGSYVHICKDDEKPRTWGLVHLVLWGEEGWTEQETELFAKSFWRYVDRAVIELVGEMKFVVKA